MPYVWLSENGRHRFVDDQWLNPCRKCGERISVCQANNCTDEPEEPEDEGCVICNTDHGCRCDEMYEAYKDSKLDD